MAGWNIFVMFKSVGHDNFVSMATVPHMEYKETLAAPL